MLGKLIKHEWRAVWKILGGVNLFLLLYTLAGVLSLHSSIWRSTNIIIESLLSLASIFYVIAVMVISFTVLIYLTVRFYRNIYTDEGYLMHTLPVSQKELIFSKLLVAFIWVAITSVTIFISIFSIAMTGLSVTDGISISQAWNDITDFIDPVWFKEVCGISISHGIILALIGSILNAIQSILMIYASISIGQLLQKHKILGSFLGYIGINACLQILNSVILTPIMLGTSLDTSATLKEFSSTILPYYYFSLAGNILLCILFFFLTEYLMKKKLNLD